jgi:hypothetical protein
MILLKTFLSIKNFKAGFLPSENWQDRRRAILMAETQSVLSSAIKMTDSEISFMDLQVSMLFLWIRR